MFESPMMPVSMASTRLRGNSSVIWWRSSSSVRPSSFRRMWPISSLADEASVTNRYPSSPKYALSAARWWSISMRSTFGFFNSSRTAGLASIMDGFGVSQSTTVSMSAGSAWSALTMGIEL